MVRDRQLFAVVLILAIAMLLVVEAFHIFWRPFRPTPVPRPHPYPGPNQGCHQCKPGTGEGNPSGCRLPENYKKCKAWEAEHPNGCCVYDATKGFTCYEGGSQCIGSKCDNAYDNSGFSCTQGGKKPPIPANPWNNCNMC